jgi:transcription-repair coupling factor (superfamily II helicase)
MTGGGAGNEKKEARNDKKVFNNIRKMQTLSTIKNTIQLPKKIGDHLDWGNIKPAAHGFLISSIAEKAHQPVIVLAQDQQTAVRIQNELNFFLSEKLPVLMFPDWETLPYDHFSPHKDILSQRLSVLFQLPQLKQGILVVSVSTLMHRLAPREYVDKHCLFLKIGESLNIFTFSKRLQHYGYQSVTQVLSHGEMSVRGSIIDVFPMGGDLPYRIDLFDDEIDSIRTFDIETQKTIEKVSSIQVLPAYEFPLNEAGIEHFRQAFRAYFAQHENIHLSNCMVYQNISQQEIVAGIEYYLPLFFDQTATLFDYLPENSLLVRTSNLHLDIKRFLNQVQERYEQLRFDMTRPLLSPKDLFLSDADIFSSIKPFQQVQFHEAQKKINMEIENLPSFSATHKSNKLLKNLSEFLSSKTVIDQQIVFSAETAGRREALLQLLKKIELQPKVYSSWDEFLENQNQKAAVIVSPLQIGFCLPSEKLILLPETHLLGEKVAQQRERQGKYHDTGTLVRHLSELAVGDPVVHIEQGVGRYLGLQTVKADDLEMEYLVLEYANQAKLYVPVSSLHLINRFSGVEAEYAPLHALGSGKWEKEKKKALSKIKDIAAELLDIYAKRESKPGFMYQKPDTYSIFLESFPFEETPDQQAAIDQVITDMTSPKHMDRLVCGDVGFGKTEVALRAAFVATQNHKQVVVLVPTTVLAEQHYQNFKDRFADWPIEIGVLSRLSQTKDQKETIEKLKTGKIDIVIGTHRLLQPNVTFKDLGLLIVDEEHRFGVQHKEKIKAKKSEVDLLTLTATPIPRTLNMAMHGIWDISLITTPPVGRLAVKTFVKPYAESLIKEAILRENLRGGQVYYVHNRVETIGAAEQRLRQLLPGIKIGVVHGQMPELQLERVMAEFYRHRFNILLCTTIIESGIDIPTANTMIIERADRFGMAQLHQLRGRVGRSHHQAYAYLLTPEKANMTPEAKRRLEALAQAEDLGVGFNLASHDLEIRGAGELLGKEQSGHIQHIGFSLYSELLDKTVLALKEGKIADIEDATLIQATKIDLNLPALIPEHYIPDIHTRLVLYKRLSNAKTKNQIDELQVEFIDRFGLLPESVKYLFEVTELKLKAQALDIQSIFADSKKGKICFAKEPNDKKLNVDALIGFIQKHPQIYQLKGSQELSFVLEGDAPEEKIQQINDLLECISK